MSRTAGRTVAGGVQKLQGKLVYDAALQGSNYEPCCSLLAVQQDLAATIAAGLLEVEAFEAQAALFQQEMSADACETRAAAAVAEEQRLKQLMDDRRAEVSSEAQLITDCWRFVKHIAAPSLGSQICGCAARNSWQQICAR